MTRNGTIGAPLPPVLLVGYGRMGSALLAGWREQGLDGAVAVDPALPPAPGPDVTVVADAADVAASTAAPTSLAASAASAAGGRSGRPRLRDRPLPFRVTGALRDPGVHFEEFSLLFDALSKESSSP